MPQPTRLASWLALIHTPSHVIGHLPIYGSLQFYYDQGLLTETLWRFPPR